MSTQSISPDIIQNQNVMVITAWEELIFPNLKKIFDPKVRQQIYFFSAYSFLGILSVTTFGILHVIEQNFLLGYLEIAFGIIILMNCIGLRIVANIGLAQSLLLLTILSILLVMLLTGGTQNTGIYWYFTFPVAAFFLTGKKAGALWVITLYLATFIILFLNYIEVVAIPYNFFEVRQLLISLFVVSFAIRVYQTVREKSEQSFEESARSLELANRTIIDEKAKDEVIVSSIGEGIFAVNKEGKVILFNDAMSAFTGYSAAEVLNRPYSDILSFTSENGQTMEDTYIKRSLTGVRLNIFDRIYLLKKDKSLLPVAFITAPIREDNGSIIGCVVTVRDVTEERKLENAKNEFLAVASHQLRTPLGGIKWNVEMLLDGDHGEVPTQIREVLEQISQNTFRMNNLVSNLLNVAYIDQGKIQEQPQDIEAQKIINTVLEEMKSDFLSKQLKISFNYSENDTYMLHIDPKHFSGVLINILSNAVKFSYNHGKIDITLSKNDKYITCEISDTGIGIPAEDQERIFDKFYRAKNAANGDTEGSGLGLFVVKSYIKKWGGDISFTSEEGRGSRFKFSLPIESTLMTKPH